LICPITLFKPAQLCYNSGISTERSVCNMRKIRTFSDDTDLVNERRDHIVKVSTELITKKGYSNITTRELASALGMSTGGLYHYIGSKEDILTLILEYMTTRTNGISNLIPITDHLPPIEALKIGIDIHYKAIDELKNMYNFLNHVMVNLPPETRRKLGGADIILTEYFENIIQRGKDLGVFEVEDPSYVAYLIMLAGHGWANRHWFLKRKYTIEQYIKITTDNILKQLMPAKQGSNLV